MTIRERIQRIKERISKARTGPLRPLDDDDREALSLLRATVDAAFADGRISADEISAIAEALEILREARANTP